MNPAPPVISNGTVQSLVDRSPKSNRMPARERMTDLAPPKPNRNPGPTDPTSPTRARDELERSAGPLTAIVIPTYNERDCLPAIVRAVRAAVPGATILVVDDNSPDGTGALADEMAAADPKVEVLHRAGKEGLGAAYLAAFRHALDDARGV